MTVTQKDAIVSSGLTEVQEHQLPHGGMAEGLLEHSVRFSLRNWLVASTNALLPSPRTRVHFEASPASDKLNVKVDTFDVVMLLTPEMSLQSMAVKGSDGDRQEFQFRPVPHGFVLGTWTMGEDGEFKAGNRLIFTYTDQAVDGFQIPAQGSINRESHHEVWRYTLSDCKVMTNNGSR